MPVDRSKNFHSAPSSPVKAWALCVQGKGYLLVTSDDPVDRIFAALAQVHGSSVLSGDDGMTCARVIASIGVNLTPVSLQAIMIPAKSATEDELPPLQELAPRSLLFTSGSTGVPKGVMTCHTAFAAYLYSPLSILCPRSDDRVSQLTPLTFDFSLHDIGLAWCIARCCRASPQAEFFNIYGPTESAVAVTIIRWFDSFYTLGEWSLDASLSGNRLLLIDEDQQPVQPGDRGHICISGVQIAQGYVGGQPSAALRFVTLPGQQGVGYLTGDDGIEDVRYDLLFRGRRDAQWPVRGGRIERGEIEDLMRNRNKKTDYLALQHHLTQASCIVKKQEVHNADCSD